MADELDETLARIRSARTSEELANAKNTALGKSGFLTLAKKGLGRLAPEARASEGARLNAAVHEITRAADAVLRAITQDERAKQLEADRIDLTERRPPRKRGRLHLVTQTQQQLEDVFVAMGYAVEEGPLVETDWHNFQALNIPPAHPARANQDTLYLNFGAPESTLLRTQTSSVQTRIMLTQTPPIYAVCPGRVYRKDTPDARHTPAFSQIEGLVVDEGITFGDLAGTIEAFTHAYFGPDINARLRPAYFPFTEPSAEFEVTCAICRGDGCRTCSNTGWIELGGCGMVASERVSRRRSRPGEMVGLCVRLRHRSLRAGVPHNQRHAGHGRQRPSFHRAVLMLVPLSWLRDFAPFDDDVDRLVDTCNALGLVVEGVERVGAGIGDVVVAKVLEVDSIKGADKIRRIVVDHGDGPVQVVCGAWNFEQGATVAFAPVGSVLPGGFAIGTRKMKGVESNGMICSELELELGDEGGGIMVLDDSLAAGTKLTDALGIEPDVVFDLAIEGNRPDALCVLGVARDLAAKLGLAYAEPSPAIGLAAPSPEGPPVSVDAPSLCPIFTATRLEGVRIGPSPAWIARRLTLAGMRPINNIVDISNYVMLELGQPTHPYDGDKLPGGGFIVRQAEPGETLVTLDGEARILGAGGEDCVIADGDGVGVGVGGIMGGGSSEIDDATSTVILEAAWFEPMVIARTVEAPEPAFRSVGAVREGRRRWKHRACRCPVLCPRDAIRRRDRRAPHSAGAPRSTLRGRPRCRCARRASTRFSAPTSTTAPSTITCDRSASPSTVPGPVPPP